MIWESLSSFEKIQPKNSRDALENLLDAADLNDIFDEIVKREKTYSHGIGKGVVLYKKREEIESPELFINVTDSPIEYDSFDGVQISIFCLIVTPEDDRIHIEFLSRFYRLINFSTFRERLIKSRNIEEVRKLIRREERGFPS